MLFNQINFNKEGVNIYDNGVSDSGGGGGDDDDDDDDGITSTISM
jgi:hypothetical protein